MSGIVASFATEEALEAALTRLRAEQVGTIETYTPKALEEDKEGTGSPLPLLIFIAGMLGAAAAYGLETYADVLNWPVDVGGRPRFSWPAFVPIAFEMGVLWAILAGFFGFLAINGLPRLWDPVDETQALGEAMRAGWVLVVHNEDEVELARARRLIQSLHPRSIELIGSQLEEIPA